MNHTKVIDSAAVPTQASRWGRRVWSILQYLVLFLVIYTLINWWRQPVMPAAPQLQLTDYQAQSVDIEALSYNAPVLVYFWGTWCSVCKLTSPTIDALAQSSAYPVVTIATQSGSNEQLGAYLNEHNFNFVTINDESGEMFEQWQGQVTPSYVILKNGKMTQGLTGIQPEWSLRLRLWLSSLLS
ncbi:protein disulfide oxidoreductase [Psychrobacter raelei]|uniref:Protein disulfide oxidoreductase n=1 Tax=Psychrobacter raelei TaxID=2565531 RepID=A0AAU6PVN1_9GAMM